MSSHSRLTFLFAVLLAAGGLARAQETPITPESLNASAAPTAFSFGEDPARRLVINGFGVATYAYNFNTDENSFADSALAISLSNLITDQISVFAQVTVAREAASPFVGDEGNFEHDVSTDIDNLQVAWVPSPRSGLSLTFGKFDSPLAIERDDAPLNFQATNSFTFDFARPVKFTGLEAHESFSPKFEGWAIFGNGWDNDTDNNNAKTGAVYALWNPSLSYHFGLGVVQGGEKDGLTGDQRTTAVATILMQPCESWVYGEEFVGGREPHAAVDGGEAKWFADMFFVHHRFGRHWAGTLRGEYFDDADGSRTGIPQILRSVTLSPQYLVGGGFYGLYRNYEHTSLRLPELALRLDLRWDRSSESVFRTRDEGVGRRDGYSATFQTVFLF
ncbi:MAG TPA: outer membrane beta-barrel protein [Thermoanaerobaculia bacterium]|nr:outer membrane beta-barrel protein [Thermoanaerobaculia bacterium]